MTSLIVLAALATVPIISLLLLRVNAAIAFMSICLGSVLVTYTSSDMVSIASGLASHPRGGLTQLVQLVLLLLPFVLVTLFTRKNVKGSKQALNVVPALASGLLIALLVTPLLGGHLQSHIQQLSSWRLLSNLQTMVLLGGAFFSLLFLLVTHRHKHEDIEKKHGKH